MYSRREVESWLAFTPNLNLDFSLDDLSLKGDESSHDKKLEVEKVESVHERKGDLLITLKKEPRKCVQYLINRYVLYLNLSN